MAGDQEAPTGGRNPTVKDVAAQAGVSWTTVSNVIHDRPHVRAAIRERVQAAIAELGYQPSLAGRELRRGRSNSLALAVQDIESPYFAHLAHQVIVEASRLGYTVSINETGGNIESERAAVGGYPGRGIEGVIFSPITIGLAEILEIKKDTPIVLLGEHVSDGLIDHVAIDNVTSARQATDHLLSLGRRSIAFMGYQPNGPQGTGDLRLKGYRQSLVAAGIEPDPSLILRTKEYTRAEGEYCAGQLLDRVKKVDAIVCANDLLAIGAMRRLRRNGISVPHDVALLGWDNTPDGEYSFPGLTTIAPDLTGIARTAVALLLARIADRSLLPSESVAAHHLVIRESTDPNWCTRVADSY